MSIVRIILSVVVMIICFNIFMEIVDAVYAFVQFLFSLFSPVADDDKQKETQREAEHRVTAEELAQQHLPEYADTDPAELVRQAYAYLKQQDWPRTVACYLSAAERGSADAQADLGYLYENGHGVSCDYQQAAQWYEKAAQQGHGAAQLALGRLYLEGKGVPEDAVLSYNWMIKAAEKGYDEAQCAVGSMYYGGMGTERDEEKAAEWYRRAAERGNAPAQYHLGVMYGRGDGVEQDVFESLKWLDLAAEQGHEEAEELSEKVKSVIYR